MITLRLTPEEARALNHLTLLGAMLELATEPAPGPEREIARRAVGQKLRDVRDFPSAPKIALAAKMQDLLRELVDPEGAAP